MEALKAPPFVMKKPVNAGVAISMVPSGPRNGMAPIPIMPSLLFPPIWAINYSVITAKTLPLE